MLYIHIKIFDIHGFIPHHKIDGADYYRAKGLWAQNSEVLGWY